VDRLNLAIIDPVPLVRAGLSASLRAEPEVELVVEAGDLDEAIAIAQRLRFDVAVTEVMTPTKSGLAIVHGLRACQPDCKILLLTMLSDPTVMGSMLAAGAMGYALKTQTISEVMAAIHCVRDGVQYLPPGVSRSTLPVAEEEQLGRFDQLTRREREVFELVVRGFSNCEIGTRLFISPRTAETHRHRITKKLGLGSMADAIRLVTTYRVLDGRR